MNTRTVGSRSRCLKKIGKAGCWVPKEQRPWSKGRVMAPGCIMGSSLAGGGSVLNNVLAHWCELSV